MIRNFFQIYCLIYLHQMSVLGPQSDPIAVETVNHQGRKDGFWIFSSIKFVSNNSFRLIFYFSHFSPATLVGLCFSADCYDRCPDTMARAQCDNMCNKIVTAERECANICSDNRLNLTIVQCNWICSGKRTRIGNLYTVARYTSSS